MNLPSTFKKRIFYIVVIFASIFLITIYFVVIFKPWRVDSERHRRSLSGYTVPNAKSNQYIPRWLAVEARRYLVLSDEKYNKQEIFYDLMSLYLDDMKLTEFCENLNIVSTHGFQMNQPFLDTNINLHDMARKLNENRLSRGDGLIDVTCLQIN